MKSNKINIEKFKIKKKIFDKFYYIKNKNFSNNCSNNNDNIDNKLNVEK